MGVYKGLGDPRQHLGRLLTSLLRTRGTVLFKIYCMDQLPTELHLAIRDYACSHDEGRTARSIASVSRYFNTVGRPALYRILNLTWPSPHTTVKSLDELVYHLSQPFHRGTTRRFQLQVLECTPDGIFIDRNCKEPFPARQLEKVVELIGNPNLISLTLLSPSPSSYGVAIPFRRYTHLLAPYIREFTLGGSIDPLYLLSDTLFLRLRHVQLWETAAEGVCLPRADSRWHEDLPGLESTTLHMSLQAAAATLECLAAGSSAGGPWSDVRFRMTLSLTDVQSSDGTSLEVAEALADAVRESKLGRWLSIALPNSNRENKI